jgi:NADH:ubiquinone oxidoreductase subunit 6 (subunit J)
VILISVIAGAIMVQCLMVVALCMIGFSVKIGKLNIHLFSTRRPIPISKLTELRMGTATIHSNPPKGRRKAK